MATYIFQSSTGQVLEIERPMGTAPKSVRRKGATYRRVYTQPVIRQLSTFERGEKPAVAHSLPKWYGYGQRETCWKKRMQQMKLDDTPANRRKVSDSGLAPSPKWIERESMKAADAAGALREYRKDGTPIAATKKQAGKVCDKGKRLGDELVYD